MLAHRPVKSVELTAHEHLTMADPIERLRVLSALTSNVSLNAATTFVADLNGTTAGSSYDQLNVHGTVALNNATFTVTLGYTPALGDRFVIDKLDVNVLIGAGNDEPRRLCRAEYPRRSPRRPSSPFFVQMFS